MSELEIIKRRQYKLNRKKWTIIQVIALALVAVIALGSFLIYDRMNQTYYIEYTEKSHIDYKVQYAENPFFKEEWIGSGQAYIASLIKGVEANLTYGLDMDAINVGFNYHYNVEAKLLIADKDSGNAYYTFTEDLIPLTQMSNRRSRGVSIAEKVSIDYGKYNDIAREFLRTYELKNATCTLIVTLNVEVLSTSDQFEQQNENTYATSLFIPLAADTFSVEITSSAPESESKVLAYKNASSRQVFYVAGIVTAILAVLQAVGLAVYLHLTKNEDVTYSARVRKILSAYGSFIQRMEGEFDDTGYQIIEIKTFTEMLGIRDTLQAPVLATENRDETMTRFLIPTNTKLLYVYEIKVDNFDEIYGRA